MLTLGRKTARERVATFLLQLSQRAERRGHNALQLQLPMKRYEIADYLGLSFETVSRHLRDLERERLISFPAVKAVAIRDPAALSTLAGYGPVEPV